MKKRLLFFVLAALGAVGSSAPAVQPAASPGRVLSLEVNGPITQATAEWLQSALDKGKADSVEAIVLVLDTPGGSLDATSDIVRKMLGSEIPIFVWVGPAGARAASAGVFISLAAHLVAMNPASHLGAAHPVSSSGKDIESEAGKDMAKKVENDTAAFVRSIAKARGRNQEWAEKAVRESVSATAEEAKAMKVVDGVVESLPAFLAWADGQKVGLPSGEKVLRTRGAEVVPLPMTIRQRTLSFLANPNMAALLMLIGTLGIALELYHPGSVFPGVVGAFCLLLGLLATAVIPVNVGAVLLLLAGAGLLVAESYLSTNGLAGLGGAICLVLGMLLFIDRSAPDYLFNPKGFSVSPLIIWPVPLALALIMGFLAYKVNQSRKRPLVAGGRALVGEEGEALSEITQHWGEVFVHGEYWRARTSGPTLPKGARVKVVAVDGLWLEVSERS
jgi:membrane-bound serine protease (ClpP class)